MAGGGLSKWTNTKASRYEASGAGKRTDVVINFIRTLKECQKISGSSESSGRSGKRVKTTLMYGD